MMKYTGALVVALFTFLFILGVSCLSAMAGGSYWGDSGFGCLFFSGAIAGCAAAIRVFIELAPLFAQLAEKENGGEKVK